MEQKTRPEMLIRPVTLEGEHVRLEPMTMAHHAALWEIAKDCELWRWTAADIRTPENLGQIVFRGASREPVRA